MTVYVDDVRHNFGNMVMCHCWADTEDELLAMMDRVGVQRRWIQRPPKASWVHFDIALVKKDLVLKAGGVLTDKYGPVLHTALLRNDQVMIERVLALRARAGLDAETGMRKLGARLPATQMGLPGL
jgi:hypothetical protein